MASYFIIHNHIVNKNVPTNSFLAVVHRTKRKQNFWRSFEPARESMRDWLCEWSDTHLPTSHMILINSPPQPSTKLIFGVVRNSSLPLIPSSLFTTPFVTMWLVYDLSWMSRNKISTYLELLSHSLLLFTSRVTKSHEGKFQENQISTDNEWSWPCLHFRGVINYTEFLHSFYVLCW